MSELPSSLERKSNDAAEFGSSNRKYMKEKSSYDVQKNKYNSQKINDSTANNSLYALKIELCSGCCIWIAVRNKCFLFKNKAPEVPFHGITSL